MKRLTHTDTDMKGGNAGRRPKDRFIRGSGLLLAGLMALAPLGCAHTAQNTRPSVASVRYQSREVQVAGRAIRTMLVAPTLDVMEAQHERRDGFYGSVTRDTQTALEGDMFLNSIRIGSEMEGFGASILISREGGIYNGRIWVLEPGHTLTPEELALFGGNVPERTEGFRALDIPLSEDFGRVVESISGRPMHHAKMLAWVERPPYLLWTEPFSGRVVASPSMQDLTSACGSLMNAAYLSDWDDAGLPYTRRMNLQVFILGADQDGGIMGRHPDGVAALRLVFTPCPAPVRVYSDIVLIQEPQRPASQGQPAAR